MRHNKDWTINILKKIRSGEQPSLYPHYWSILERTGYIERIARMSGYQYNLTTKGEQYLNEHSN